MSDPNAEFLQQYKQVCLKSHFQLGVKCNLTFFFGFALVCTAIVHEKLCQSLNQFSAKMFFFLNIFFSDEWLRLKTSDLETICSGQFFIINSE